MPLRWQRLQAGWDQLRGPAPRPLDRIRLSNSPKGVLVVGKGQIFRMGPGVDPEQQYPQSILKA